MSEQQQPNREREMKDDELEDPEDTCDCFPPSPAWPLVAIVAILSLVAVAMHGLNLMYGR